MNSVNDNSYIDTPFTVGRYEYNLKIKRHNNISTFSFAASAAKQKKKTASLSPKQVYGGVGPHRKKKG